MKDEIKIGYSKNYTTILDIRAIDFNDKKAIMKEIDDFVKKYAYADVEHALEISPNGNAFRRVWILWKHIKVKKKN